MTNQISDADARLALHSIEQQRRDVIAEVDLPNWYWWGLAAGWVALGVIADIGNAWLGGAATLVFGAAHSAVAGRVLTGRHKSNRLTVHRDVVSRHLPVVMFGCLIALAAITVALGFLADADGADHPSTMASIAVAVAIILGGPNLMAAVRRRAERGTGE